MRRSTFFLAICLPAMILTSCGQQGAPNPPGTEAAVPAGNSVPQTSGGPTPAVGPADAATGSLWNGGAQQALDIQSAHPNGVVLQLTSLQSRPTETAIGIRVMNGRDREIQLNRFNNRNGYLVPDNGDRLYLSPPANNARINIPAGQTLEGELVFLGRLPPTQGAVLILNENAGTDNRHTTTPGFRIDLPLAGSGS